MAGPIESVSERTLVDWNNFCREVCGQIVQLNCELIGRPGKVIEIGKRNYHRGRRVDGVWVFGGTE